MRERIKAIRKHAGVTQAEFATSLGLGPYGTANWEKKDAQIPTESMQLLICKTYGINKHWLETGEGDMFENKTEDEILVDQALRKANASPVVRSLLMAWAKLPESCQLALEEYAAQFAAEYHSQQTDADDADLSDQVRANIQANAVNE